MERLPKVGLHRSTGQARIRLNGHEVWLGPYGSTEAQAAYKRELSRWLEEGRTYVPPQARLRSVTDLGDLYLEHARVWYRKGNRQTNSVGLVERALELLERSGEGRSAVDGFGPRRLSAFQRWLAADPQQRWARSTINRYTQIIVQMFRWAAHQELADESQWRALRSVGGLRKGRPVSAEVRAPRDGGRVLPVPSAHLRRTRRAAHRQVRAMIDLQLSITRARSTSPTASRCSCAGWCARARRPSFRIVRPSPSHLRPAPCVPRLRDLLPARNIHGVENTLQNPLRQAWKHGKSGFSAL